MDKLIGLEMEDGEDPDILFFGADNLRGRNSAVDGMYFAGCTQTRLYSLFWPVKAV